MIKIKRGKRINIKPVDDAAFIYTSSAQEKYSQMFKEFKKHPHKLVEYYTGDKLSLWQKIYLDVTGKLKKTDYEKQQKVINKAVRAFIRKR